MKKIIVLLSILPSLAFAQTFDRDLYFGMQKDADVTKLQEFLTDQGLYSGPISGNFFSLTLAGVKVFQSKQGITPTSGYFGPKTRAKANIILTAQGVSSNGVTDEAGNTTPAVVTPPKTTNDTVSALMAQIQLIQQQLDALRSQQQTLQTIQQQQVGQTQTLQTIQQNTTPTPVPTPIPSPTSTVSTPQPTPTIVQSGGHLEILNMAALKTTIVASGYDTSTFNVVVWGSDGKSVDGPIVISTDDPYGFQYPTGDSHTLTYTQNGAGSCPIDGKPGDVVGPQGIILASRYYCHTITYRTTNSGTHSITISVPDYGLTQTIYFQATPFVYTRMLPTMTFDNSVPVAPMTLNVNTQNNVVAAIKIYNPDQLDQYYVKNITFGIISDTLTNQDVGLSLWDGTTSVWSGGTTSVIAADPFNGNAVLSGGTRVLLIKANVSKIGTFKLSVNARFFSVNEGTEYVLSNLPLITSDIEVK